MTLHARLAALALALPLAAAAAGPHVHDHATDHQPQHGGTVAEFQHNDVELVATPEGISLYVREQGQPVSTAGAQARLTLLAGGKKTELALAPAGGNRLLAKGQAGLGPGAKVLATVALANRPPMTLRFEIR